MEHRPQPTDLHCVIEWEWVDSGWEVSRRILCYNQREALALLVTRQLEWREFAMDDSSRSLSIDRYRITSTARSLTMTKNNSACFYAAHVTYIPVPHDVLY